MKTVLFLINGFGMENKSFSSVYDDSLMPNLSSIKKEYVSGVLKSNTDNYQESYRNLSLDINELYTYSIVNESFNNGTLMQNSNLLQMKNTLETRNGKLQLFCFVDKSPLIVENLKHILTILNPLKNKNIFLHLILTSNNIKDYPEIINISNRISLELNGLAKIGMILGQDYISNNKKDFDLVFFVKILISEVGDRWQGFKEKLQMCYSIKQLPNLVKPFIVNNGFSLSNNDLVMFLNYDNIDHTNFIDTVKKNYVKEGSNIDFYSLFPITYNEVIPYVLNYQIASKSLASNTLELDFNALVLANRNQINIINYYLNGLQNVSNPKINYIEFDNYLYKPNELLSIINNYNHGLMIINYSIDDVNTIEELKHTLQNIDIMLGNVYQNSKQNNYNMVISSLYGINKTLNNDEKVTNISFEGQVPVIYVNNSVLKKDYLIKDGTVNDLIKICYKSINDSYQGCFVIVKKNFFERLFAK